MKIKIILAALAAIVSLVVVGCRFGIGELSLKELEALTIRGCAE